MALESEPIFVVAFLWIVLVYWVGSRRRAQHRLPPGPRKLPLIGNILEMPTKEEWKTYAMWAKKYDSDTIHVNAIGTSIVILNSYSAAKDLLEKRSSIYSSRPHTTMYHELSGWGFTFALLPYGDAWRAGRRMFTKHFNSSNPHINQPRETRYVRRFLGQLLQKPDDFLEHVRNLVGSTTLSMTYGIDVRPFKDPYIDLAEEAVIAASELMTAGNFLVDFLPVLKYIPEWFPGAVFQRKAAKMRQQASKVRELPFVASEKLMMSGNYEPSFVSEALKGLEHSGAPKEDREHLKDVAGQVYIAGADTTASALSTFFLAMVCFPEAQKKAQAELDKVLNGRLPEHSDIPSLPYLSGVIREVYRWQPVTPMGVPHSVIMDDLYNNYYIPANSIIFANQWAMLYDENEYPEPHEFKPERFMQDGKLNRSVRDPMDVAFGFGRRVCSGRYLAHSTITLAAAAVLSTFDLLKKVDADGHEIEPAREYHLAMISRPLHFPCVIKPRSHQTEDLIRSSYQFQDGEQ